MPAAVTRLDIEAEILRYLTQGDPEASMVPIPLYVDVSTTTTVRASILARGTGNANRFDGRIIKIADTENRLIAYTDLPTVNGAHSSVTTTLLYTCVSDPISAGDVIGIVGSDERMLVTGMVTATNTLTVVRGYYGTTAAALAGGESIRFAPLGMVVGVDDGGFDAIDQLTFSPALSMLLDRGMKTHLYPKGLAPETLTDHINRVLRGTEAPHFWIPSLISDSNFDANDLTNWDEVGSGTTRAFTTTAANVLYGTRALSIISADAGEGAESEDFYVTENENLVVMAFVKVTAGSIEVTLRRVTATAADIERADGLSEGVWTSAFFSGVIPSGCTQASIRFLSEATGSAFFVSAHVVAQSQSRRRYSVPSWFYREGQQVAAVRIMPSYTSVSDDSGFTYISEGDRLVDDLNATFLRSDLDANPLWAEFACPSSYPVAFMVKRAFAELAGDLSTTTADREYVAAKAVANLLRDRSDDAWRMWARKAMRRAEKLGYGGNQLRGEELLTAV